ncbi:hypothetical protein Rs2_35444 [Raphanus sativus]|nr:hypothetical protein Rs2_35444 [Raphanus sativus]
MDVCLPSDQLCKFHRQSPVNKPIIFREIHLKDGQAGGLMTAPRRFEASTAKITLFFRRLHMLSIAQIHPVALASSLDWTFAKEDRLCKSTTPIQCLSIQATPTTR